MLIESYISSYSFFVDIEQEKIDKIQKWVEENNLENEVDIIPFEHHVPGEVLEVIRFEFRNIETAMAYKLVFE